MTLTASLSAHAGEETKTILNVEYWGTVTSSYDGSGPATHKVGDSLHGLIRVDTSLAPPDRATSAADEGNYIWNNFCDRICPPRVDAPSGFVTSDLSKIRGTSDDFVSVFDLFSMSGGYADTFTLMDREQSPGQILELQLGILAPVDFIRGDGLIQSFDIRPADVGAKVADGRFAEFFNAFSRTFDFVVDRLRVSPKVCRAG
jgi:hypothetical protein